LGYVKLFSRLEGNSLEAWIRQRVKSAGGQISHRAVHMLAINVGNNLDLLDNELEKLIIYKGSLPIEVDDISLLCPFVAESSIFELVDAVGIRHGGSAAQLLQNKLNEGTDPSYLFAMIVRQFRLLIQVKELAENGAKPAVAAKELKIHSYVAGKIYQQSHNFSLAQLEQIYERLLEIDIEVKTGQTDLTTALCLLVAGTSV
jgi:DNA polymerase-3 subunit delta